MKVLTLALAVLMALTQTVLAAPVDAVDAVAAPASDDSVGSVNGAAPAAAGGTPVCKDQYRDLCLADNANAYCSNGGFRNNFPEICKGLCWCV
ncbi:hypothetical protein VTJ83DRAFT_4511 [Remersonia thermophila]|uniref:Uncharacterized protein n=1 Tax=Remersonia thermophila TaxID=72144 RepID=A0ABR4DA45_9PEZI